MFNTYNFNSFVNDIAILFKLYVSWMNNSVSHCRNCLGWIELNLKIDDIISMIATVPIVYFMVKFYYIYFYIHYYIIPTKLIPHNILEILIFLKFISNRFSHCLQSFGNALDLPFFGSLEI